MLKTLVLLFPTETIQEYQEILNRADPTGKERWTYAIEDSSGKLPFLDCELIHVDDSIRINLYRKPSANSRYTPYNSADCQMRRSQFIDCFLHRIDKICDHEFIDQNREWLKNTALINDIPLQIYEQRVTTYELRKLTPSSDSPRKDFRRIVLPYSDTLTEKIRNATKDVFEVVTKPFTLAQRFAGKLKFPTPPHLRSSPIYAAFCANENCKKRYYGETSLTIQNRFHLGHWPAIDRTDPAKSALAFHEQHNPGHYINPNIVLVCCEPNTEKRLIKEAIYGRIIDQKLSINYDWDLLKHADEDDLPSHALFLRRHGKLTVIPPMDACSEK